MDVPTLTQLVVDSLIGQVEGVDNLSEETGEFTDENKVLVLQGGEQFIITIEENKKPLDLSNNV
jgi:hypothetical protein